MQLSYISQMSQSRRSVLACIANDIEKEEAYMADNIAHMACMLGLGPGEGQYWITL